MATVLAKVRSVTEIPLAAEVPAYAHPEWAHEFPWLVQGITARGAGPGRFDLAPILDLGNDHGDVPFRQRTFVHSRSKVAIGTARTAEGDVYVNSGVGHAIAS